MIYSRNSPEGPGHPTGGVGGAHGGRRGHQDGHQDGHREHLWGVEWVVEAGGCADDIVSNRLVGEVMDVVGVVANR